MGSWIDEQVDIWIVLQMGRQIDGQIDRWVGRQMGRQIDGQVDRWVNRQIGREIIDRQKGWQIYVQMGKSISDRQINKDREISCVFERICIPGTELHHNMFHIYTINKKYLFSYISIQYIYIYYKYMYTRAEMVQLQS